MQWTLNRRAYLRTSGTVGAVVGAGFAGCLGGGGPGPSAGPEITAGTAPGFPPFEIIEGGELTGFDVDLLEAVVDETDRTLAGWEEFEFEALIPALTSGLIDVIAAAMTITGERQQTIAFSEPYWNANQSIVVRSGEAFSPSSLEDLSGHTVGAQLSTTGANVVQNEVVSFGVIAESEYSTYADLESAVGALENGTVDAIVVDEPAAETFADQGDVRIAFVYETDERYGFGLRQSDEGLRTAIDGGLQTVRDSGEYDDLRNEWFGQG